MSRRASYAVHGCLGFACFPPVYFSFRSCGRPIFETTAIAWWCWRGKPEALAKILIHSINYLPELTGIGKFTGEMGTWLTARGHAVRVVTTPPYYPEWRVPPAYRKRWYARETIDGADVIRCPFWVPARLSSWKRVVHLASFSASALPMLLWQALVWRPDVVFVVKPPAFSLPGGWMAAAFGGARAWLHVQDFEVDAAFEMGLLKGGLLRRAVLGLEAWWMRRYDFASSISERMLDKLRAKGIPESESALFPNWADIEHIAPLDRPSTFRAELGLPAGSVVALYAGNMGDKQGLEVMVDAARRLAGERAIRFVLAGEGAARARLEAEARGLAQRHVPAAAAARPAQRAAEPRRPPSAAPARRCRRSGDALQARRHAGLGPAGGGGRPSRHPGRRRREPARASWCRPTTAPPWPGRSPSWRRRRAAAPPSGAPRGRGRLPNGTATRSSRGSSKSCWKSSDFAG